MIGDCPIGFKTEGARAIFVFLAVSAFCLLYHEPNLIVAMAVSADLFWAACRAVVLIGSKFKVGRIHAMSAMAVPMIQFQSRCNIPSKQYPRGLVRAYNFVIKPDLAVPVFVFASRPEPASSGPIELEFRGEPVKQGIKFARHKKAADPLLLNQAHEMPRAGNRLLSLMFSYLSAVQCRCDSLLHFAINHASSFRTVQQPQPCRAAHAAGRS